MRTLIGILFTSLLIPSAISQAAEEKYVCPPPSSIARHSGAQTVLGNGEPGDQVLQGHHYSARDQHGEWRGFVPHRVAITEETLTLRHQELDKYPPVCSYETAAGIELKLSLHPVR